MTADPHLDIRLVDEPTAFDHHLGGAAECACPCCGGPCSTFLSLDARDPRLAAVSGVFERVPVVFCAKCCTTDFSLQIQWQDGTFSAVQLTHRQQYYPEPDAVPLRPIALGPPIELDERGWPRFTGIGAVSSENAFMQIRGQLEACCQCGQPLRPLFFIANPGNSSWRKGREAVQWLYDVVVGDFFYPDADAMMIGLCSGCRVIGQQIGPF